MKNSNQEIVNKYFEAYSKHDFIGINTVMSEQVKWYFLGEHPYAGVKHGIAEVVAFFDLMAGIMGQSKPKLDKLILAENDDYFIECQHSSTQRDDGINLDHYTTVLWTIKDGKIIEGRHFFADPMAVNRYFTDVALK